MHDPRPPSYGLPRLWRQRKCNLCLLLAVAVVVTLHATAFFWNLSGAQPPVGERTFFTYVTLTIAWSVIVALASYRAGSYGADGLPALLDVCADGEKVGLVEEPSSVLIFSVNGVERRLVHPSPAMLLSEYLRGIGLTGTKVACGEGGCGSCTVVEVGEDGVPRAINSCLRLLCACDGLAITTTEGLGSQTHGFSQVQEAIAESGGSQCGFCTPGWVGAMSALLARSRGKILTSAAIERSLDGNLCRWFVMQHTATHCHTLQQMATCVVGSSCVCFFVCV